MSRIRSKFDLTGKTAIVTGASKGIGESIARGFAEFGANVVVSSRKQEAVDAVAASFKKDGLSAIGIECHVAKEDHQVRLVEKTMEAFGRVDILVNNAGTNPYFGPVDKMPMHLFDKTMDINMKPCIQISNLVYPHMKEQCGGSIMHVSSIEGIHATANFTAYNTTKAAVIMLTKNQAIEWGAHNIRVNCICPGFVKTKLSAALWQNEEIYKGMMKAIPLSRMAEPDEMAGLACFLASDAASYCTGEVFVNDGGILNANLF